jgi:acyl carrier protein
MSGMNINDLKTVIASTFEVPEDQITNDCSSGKIPQWDSIGHLNLILALEERFKISFTVDEIMALRDVTAIWTVLEGKVKAS